MGSHGFLISGICFLISDCGLLKFGASHLVGRAAETGTQGRSAATARTPEGGAWQGTRILEFGSGAAGPIASRYFAEHGATVLRVESRGRPDFLRHRGRLNVLFTDGSVKLKYREDVDPGEDVEIERKLWQP